ncbi:unnamed protein product, partial [Hapterophycus canaliculatus]
AKILAEQAIRSLSAMPRHLVIGDAEERVEDALGLEERSLSQNQVHGPDEGDIEDFMQRGFMPFGDPFQATVTAALEEVGAKATAQRYRTMLNGGEDEDTFLDEEEEAERDAILQKLLGDIDLDGLLDVGEHETDKQTETILRSPPIAANWQITYKTDEISAHTGADALEHFLKRLVSESPESLEKLQSVRGRIRPLIANT